MKKFYFAFIALLSAGTVLAQSQRTVLVEEFTNASCPPCAAQNPGFNTLLQANVNKIVSIKYQTNWPGVDPMNAQTQSLVGPRVSYYGVTGVPFGAVDGSPLKNDCNAYVGAPACFSQAEADAEYLSPASFDLSISHSYVPTFDSVSITINIHCTQAITGNFVLHTALVEKEVRFSSAPGTNGEKEFYGVMRTMVPGSAGAALNSSWIVGDNQTINYTVKVPAYIYNKNNLAVLAFIQDNTTFTASGSTTSGSNIVTLSAADPNIIVGTYISGAGLATGSAVTAVSGTTITLSDNATASSISTNFTLANKSVAQAGISEPVALDLDASVQNFTTASPLQCVSAFVPSVALTNTGLTDLTSVDFTYKLNNGLYIPFNWTGTLTNGNSISIPFPAQTVIAGTNTFTANITAVNGGADRETGNNSFTSSVTANLAAPVAAPIFESYATTSFPPSNWSVINGGSATYKWLRFAYGYNAGSAKIDFWNGPKGDVDELITPKIDLSSAITPSLTFQVSKAFYSTAYADNLTVLASSDCGQNWTSIFSKTDPSLSTLTLTTGAYSPASTLNASQWRMESVSLDQFVGQPEVLLDFRATSGNGNNLYIDDINITTAVGLNSHDASQFVNLFPVPTSGMIYIDLESIKSNSVSINITDLSGKMITQFVTFKKDNTLSIDMSSYAAGTYFVNIEAEGQKLVKKVVLDK